MRRALLAVFAIACVIAAVGGLGGTGPAIAQVQPQTATLTVTCSADPCAAGSTLTVALPNPNSACTFNVTANTGTVQFEQTNNSAATGPWIALPLQKNDYSGNNSSTSGTYYGSQVVLSGIAVRARLSGAGSATVTISCQQVAMNAVLRSSLITMIIPTFTPPPTATPGPTNTPYPLAISSYAPNHWWKLNDVGTSGPYSNCPGTFLDYGSSSTVALTTPNPVPSIYCGSVPIDAANTPSVEFNGGNYTDFITVPNGTMPNPASNFTIVMSVQYTGYTNAGTATTPNFLVWDNSNHWNAGCDTMGRVNVYNGANIGGGGSTNGCTGVQVLFGFTYTASSTSETLWVNGAPAGTGVRSITAQNAAGALGSGLSGCGTGCDFAGRISNIWWVPSVLTQTDWEKIYYAWKCGGKPAGTC